MKGLLAALRFIFWAGIGIITVMTGGLGIILLFMAMLGRAVWYLLFERRP